MRTSHEQSVIITKPFKLLNHCRPKNTSKGELNLLVCADPKKVLLFWEQNKVSALVFLYDIGQTKRNNQYNISISRLCSLNTNKKITNTMKILQMRSRWSIKVFNYGKGHPFPLRMKPEASRHLHSSVPTKINNLVRLLRDNHGSVDLSCWSKNYSLSTSPRT